MYADEGDDNADKWWLKVDQDGTGFYLQNYVSGSTETNLKAIGNGGVELYYDNTLTCYTSNGCLSFPDDQKIFMGGGNDLQIYHDGSNSYIKAISSGAGDLLIMADGKKIKLTPKNGDEGIVVIPDGAVELYYNNDLKLKTVADGVELKSTGDVNLYLNADTDNSGEGDNPKIIFQQDGGVEHLEIGVEGPAGTRFTNSQENTPYLITSHSGHGMEFATAGTRRMRINNGGTIDGDFNDTSDGNLKENVVSIGSSIDKVKTLRPVTFDWKDTTKPKNYSGFIAQEVKTIYPNIISGEEHTAEEPWKNYSLNTTGLVAHLTKALQEAITKIETLETKVAALEAK